MTFLLSLLGSILQWANNLSMSAKLGALITMDAVIIVLVTSILALICSGYLIVLIIWLMKTLIQFIKTIFAK